MAGLFGGGTNKINTKTNLTGYQKMLNRSSRKAVRSYLHKTAKHGPGLDLPKRKLVQPFDPMQIAGQKAALAAVPGMQDVANAGSTYTQNLLSQDPSTAGQGTIADQPGYDQESMNFLLHKVLYPESNPALQGAIDAAVRPITQQLTEEQLPSIRGGAVTSGNFGSSRQGIAEGLASGRASSAIGDTSANLANEGYKAGLGALTTTFGNIANADTSRYGTYQSALSNLYNTNVNSQLNALGLLPQTQGSLLAPALTTSAVGDVRQGQHQAQRDENIYRKLFSQTSPFTSAQNLTSLAGAVPGGSTNTTQQLPGTNPILGGLGALAGITGLFPNIGQTLGRAFGLNPAQATV